jgi:rubrerythrin
MPTNFKCEECGHTFSIELDEGDAKFVIYRCDECDRVLRAELGAKMPKTLDQPCQCGGTYWKGRPPKCPNCRSSHVREEK